jgi:hypothetical protein
MCFKHGGGPIISLLPQHFAPHLRIAHTPASKSNLDCAFRRRVDARRMNCAQN